MEPERSCSASNGPGKAQPRQRFTVAGVVAGAVAFVVVVLTGCRASPSPQVIREATTTIVDREPLATIAGPVRRGPLDANGVVRRVVDGDTIQVALLRPNGTLSKETESIRLIGIDTPETKRPDTPIECFGKKASAATASLLPPNTPVRLERDVEERDRYGRLLAYVFRASDGLFVNHELVRTGFAASYPYPPNVAYSDVFRDAADAAQAVGVGLWGMCGDPHVPAT